MPHSFSADDTERNEAQARDGERNDQEGVRMSHTPGPWTAYDGVIYANMSEGCATDECGCEDGEHQTFRIGEAYSTPGYPGLQQANARLIAAAPELLAALEAINGELKNGRIQWSWQRQSASAPYHNANTRMRAALAHATGGPP